MSKLHDHLTLAANVSVVAGIIFLAVQMAQNTRAIQSMTRDSITEKQMEYYGWLANNRDLTEVVVTATERGVDDLDVVDQRVWMGFAVATLREWENSHYQRQNGLFSAVEYEGREANMRAMINTPGFRWAWRSERDKFSPAFRATIDGFLVDEPGT